MIFAIRVCVNASGGRIWLFIFRQHTVLIAREELDPEPGTRSGLRRDIRAEHQDVILSTTLNPRGRLFR